MRITPRIKERAGIYKRELFPVIFHKIHGKKNQITSLTVGEDAVSGKEGIGLRTPPTQASSRAIGSNSETLNDFSS